jgi:hypothetical protein
MGRSKPSPPSVLDSPLRGSSRVPRSPGPQPQTPAPSRPAPPVALGSAVCAGPRPPPAAAPGGGWTPVSHKRRGAREAAGGGLGDPRASVPPPRPHVRLWSWPLLEGRVVFNGPGSRVCKCYVTDTVNVKELVKNILRPQADVMTFSVGLQCSILIWRHF